MVIVTIGYLHGRGGAERQIIMLSNELAKLGHHVHFIVLAERKSSYFVDNKVIIHDLTRVEYCKKLKILRRFNALKKELSIIKPDISIHYNFQSTYFCAVLPKSMTGKIIYSERGDPYDKEYSGILGFIRKLTLPKIDGFVFQSEGAKNYFKLNQRQKAIVIYNSVAVEQDRYPIAAFRDNRIVTVGRLHPQKNPHLLIDAFKLIADVYKDYTLEFYGDGELKDELQKKIYYIGLQKRIHLNASRQDIFDCIRTARLFILSSDYEGMPNALMEAMALGLPCIATDCRPGSVRTLIEDGKNGIIVPVCNPKIMAAKMAYLLENSQLSESIAKEARHLGETHTNKVVFNMWNNFLTTVSK